MVNDEQSINKGILMLYHDLLMMEDLSGRFGRNVR